MITLKEEMQFVEYRPGMIYLEPKYDSEVFEVTEWYYEKGASVESHAHDHATISRIIEGKIRLKEGDEEKVLGPGCYYFTPAGVIHQIVEVLEPSIELVIHARSTHTHTHPHK
jgi:quercetin dioxygenase-like cupin family protein